MAKLIAIGAAQAISQINTITMTGTFSNGDTVVVNVGTHVQGKKITYTCGSSETVTTVASGVLALCQASTDAEFREITWTSAAGVVTATGTAGIPFNVSCSDTASSGTATLGAGTSATGPNFWDNPANWSTGSAPTTNDEVYIQDKSIILRYGLPTSLALDKFVQEAGEVGLPDRNLSGYPEYRDTRAVITCSTINLGRSVGVGPTLCRLSLASAASTVTVFGSAPTRNTLPPIDLIANNSGATVSVISGNVSIAEGGDETTTVGTVRAATGATVSIGSAVTITTVVNAGQMTLASNVTNATVDDGQLTLVGTATITTLTIRGGVVVHISTGTITTANVGPGLLDCAQDIRPRTITSMSIKKGGTFRDTYNAVTVTNGITLGTDADSMSAS